MTQEIVLSRAHRKDTSLPLSLFGKRSAVFGISGSGKSNTATLILEQGLRAGEQVIYIDVKGEAYGLLSKADGSPSNLDILIFGGSHGHIPQIDENQAEKLADFAVDSGRSIALSLQDMPSDEAERRLVTRFLQRLYRRKSQHKQKTRTLVVIEEAHLFVPESQGGGQKGDRANMVSAVQRIARQGRSAGLGTMIVDQRPQDVSKRVISQCDLIICHQLIHNLDRKALADWLNSLALDQEKVKEFLASLSSLRPGEAWVWSPSDNLFYRVQVDRRATFDTGANPEGEVGSVEVRRKEVDLDKLKTQLAEVVEKARQDDPAHLRKRIAELERQAKSAPVARSVIPSPAPEPAGHRNVVRMFQVQLEKIMALEKPAAAALDAAALEKVVRDAAEAAARSVVAAVQKQHAGLMAPWLKWQREVNQHLERFGEILAKAPSAQDQAPTATPAAPAPAAPKPDRKPVGLENGLSGTLSRMGRAMLVSLAQHPGGLTKKKILIHTGYASSGPVSGTFATLLREGWAEAAGNELRITPAGLAELGAWDPLPKGDALREYLLGGDRLSTMEKKLLAAICEAYPGTTTKKEVLEKTGYASSGPVSGAFAKLIGLNYVTQSGPSVVKAAEELFD